MRSCPCSCSCSRSCTCANSCSCFVVVILSIRRAHADIVCSVHLDRAFLVTPRLQGGHTTQAKTDANASASAHAPLAAPAPPPQRPPLLLLHILLRLVFFSIYQLCSVFLFGDGMGGGGYRSLSSHSNRNDLATNAVSQRLPSSATQIVLTMPPHAQLSSTLSTNGTLPLYWP